jgi:hypothetical protein
MAMSVAPEDGRNRIMIYGPKNDGSYLVEFRIADGEALVISVPAGETRVLKYFQERMPTGFSCRRSTQKSCAGRELVGAAQEIPWGPITAPGVFLEDIDGISCARRGKSWRGDGQSFRSG